METSSPHCLIPFSNLSALDEAVINVQRRLHVDRDTAASIVHPQESSLHPKQFDVEADIADVHADVEFRHSFWKPRRERVMRILLSHGAQPARMHSFATCGKDAWVQRAIGKDGLFRVISAKCKDRFCEACQRERRLRIAVNLRQRMPNARTRFVTFTLKSSRDRLADQLDRLVDCFAKLRRGKKLAACFAGGIWFIETTRNKNTGLWHPHLHVLTQGDFIPVDKLRHDWHRITGDSFIVDVKEVKDANMVCGYVTKYCTKACNIAEIQDDADLLEIMQAFSCRHMFRIFGSWKGLKLNDPPSTDIEWEYVGKLASIRRNAKAGDEESLNIMFRIRATDAAVHSPEDPSMIEPPPF